MLRRTPFAVLAIALLACRPATPAGDPADLVLPNVTVIDGLGGQPLAARTIEIRNGAIVAIRPARPDDRDSLGVAGGFVIPGIFDTHVHLGQDAATLSQILDSLLRSGVTSVREMACCADLIGRSGRRRTRRRCRGSSTRRSGRIRCSSGWTRVSSTPWRRTAPWLLGVTDTTDLPAAIRAAKTAGATGIKIYSESGAGDGDRDRLARRIAVPLRVWSHPVIFLTRPSEAIGAGVDVVSHAALLAWGRRRLGAATLQRGSPLQRVRSAGALCSVPPSTPPAVLRVLEAMRDRGTILDATISTMRRLPRRYAMVAAPRRPHRRASRSWRNDREHFVDDIGRPRGAGRAGRGRGALPLEAITAATANAARAVEPGTASDPSRWASWPTGGPRRRPSTTIGNARRVTRVLKRRRVRASATGYRTIEIG
ncbi:MAG: hypothetical protein R2909_13050 [Gemmatimonadales bacterium]